MKYWLNALSYTRRLTLLFIAYSYISFPLRKRHNTICLQHQILHNISPNVCLVHQWWHAHYPHTSHLPLLSLVPSPGALALTQSHPVFLGGPACYYTTSVAWVYTIPVSTKPFTSLTWGCWPFSKESPYFFFRINTFLITLYPCLLWGNTASVTEIKSSGANPLPDTSDQIETPNWASSAQLFKHLYYLLSVGFQLSHKSDFLGVKFPRGMNIIYIFITFIMHGSNTLLATIDK